MLSPGEHFKTVPKAAAGNAAFRASVLASGAASAADAAALKRMCAEDVLFFTNVFATTFDPRTKGKYLPFITYPYQDRGLHKMLDCVERGRDLVIEKSRDMGASWMSVLCMAWLWQFHPGVSFLMISRNEKLVDGGTDEAGSPASLFWKIDLLLARQPEWLRPAVVNRKRLHFGNGDLGSTIDGEATTAAAGVGDRRTAVFVDEFSRIEKGWDIVAGTADVTNCRIFNFTPWGRDNAAYKLARRSDVAKLRMHWGEHPEKAAGLYRYDEKQGRVVPLDKGYEYPPDFEFVTDGKLRSPWYDHECRRRANDREVAVMLDIDYEGSEYQFFDRATIAELKQGYARDPAWEGDVEFHPDTAAFEGVTPAPNGPLKLWFRPDAHGRPPAARYYAGADISDGTGATNSCFSVVNGVTGEKVAEYTSPFLRPERFAERCVALCRWFKSHEGDTARFAWEMQGPGIHFAKRILELNYGNVYFRRNEQSLSKKQTDTPGWYPSPDNKRTLLSVYRAALSARRFVNRSEKALDECLAFVVTPRGTVEHADTSDAGDGPPDPSGAGANHGDRVIADALAWMLAEPNVPQIGAPGLGGEPVPPGSPAHRRELAAQTDGLTRWDR